MPDAPTQDEWEAAVTVLLDPLFDFPFRASCDRAAAVAAILSLVARHAIAGPVPLFTPRSPAPGTGKTLLADVVAIVGTGRSAARMTAGDDDGESRKLILAVALEGAPVVLLDNVDKRLGSHALAAALTADTWADRLLGVSELVTAPLRAVWLATGNNLVFRGDLGRRVVPVDLDADMENPEERDRFRHADLRAWVEGRRPELVSAALTVLRAYHLAGRPAHGAHPMGSFEAWDGLIRGACVGASSGDPLEGRELSARSRTRTGWRSHAALEGREAVFGQTASPRPRRCGGRRTPPSWPRRCWSWPRHPDRKAGNPELGVRPPCNARDRWVNGRRFVQAETQRAGVCWRVEVRTTGGCGDAAIAGVF